MIDSRKVPRPPSPTREWQGCHSYSVRPSVGRRSLPQRRGNLCQRLRRRLRHRAVIGQKTVDLVLDVGGLRIDRGAEAIFLRLPDHALHLATEADEIFLLVLGDLIAPIALARFPDMARHREADAAIFADHDRAVRLDRKSNRLNSS